MTQSQNKKQMSERAIAANQANAQRSTGPKSDEGKERSRLNAMKHGAYCIIVDPVLPTEDMDQFNALKKSVMEMYHVDNVMQAFFLESMAGEMWCFARLNQQETNAIIYTPDPAFQNSEMMKVTLLKQRKLNIIAKLMKEYRTTYDRGKAARAEAGIPDDYEDIVNAVENVIGDASIIPIADADVMQGYMPNKYVNTNPNVTSGAYNKLNDLNLSKVNKPNPTMQDLVRQRLSGIPLGTPPDVTPWTDPKPNSAS